LYDNFIKKSGHEPQGHDTTQEAQIPGYFTVYMVQYQCDTDHTTSDISG